MTQDLTRLRSLSQDPDSSKFGTHVILITSRPDQSKPVISKKKVQANIGTYFLRKHVEDYERKAKM